MFIEKKATQMPITVNFSSEGVTFLDSTGPDCAAYLAQLAEMGLVSFKSQTCFIAWPDFYDLTENPDHADSLDLLELPSWSVARPVLSSSGALTDSKFQINLEGWREPSGAPIRGAHWNPDHGAVFESGGRKTLLQRPVWELVDAVIRFAEAPHKSEANYQNWGRIRRLALAAGANLDDFLSKTIVLTPETLKLDLDRLEDQAIRVTPGFEDAPADWLARFDRLPDIPDYYNLPQAGGGLIHVAITEPLSRVLREIKRMPERIARSPRALAFVRNPYAVLGEAAEEVIPPESYEASLCRANIVFYTFEIDAEQDRKGNIQVVFLDLCATRSGVVPSFQRFEFKSPEELSVLVETIQRQLTESFPCFNWQGFEVELRGDAGQKLAQLRSWHERWLNPVAAITYEEIYEFRDYAPRVIEIGEQCPYYSPFIIKTKEEVPWLPDNTLVGISSADPDSLAVLI
ncbi:MAG: hypothetical protein ACRERU_13600, partial [Methylococcales bacterium]